MDKIEALIKVGTEGEVLQWAKENGFTKAYSLYSYRSIKIDTLIKRWECFKNVSWFVCQTDTGEFIAHDGESFDNDALASEVYRFRKDE